MRLVVVVVVVEISIHTYFLHFVYMTVYVVHKAYYIRFSVNILHGAIKQSYPEILNPAQYLTCKMAYGYQRLRELPCILS